MMESSSPTKSSDYQLIALPARQDNYIWLVRNSTHAWVVDPSLAQPVHDYIVQHGLILADLLITHHHYDHVEGIKELAPLVQGRIIGDSDRIDGLTERVHAPAQIQLSFSNITVEVLSTPGHTYDHVSYYSPQWLQNPVLFSGDSLFSAGCGRIFDGTMEQAFQTIGQFLTLPDETLLACTHEYTLSNLAFALQIQATHPATQSYLNQVKYARESGLPSLPSNIGLEKTVNPFCWAINMTLPMSQTDVDWIKGLNRLAAKMNLTPIALEPEIRPEADFASHREWTLALFTLCRELKNRI